LYVILQSYVSFKPLKDKNTTKKSFATEKISKILL